MKTLVKPIVSIAILAILFYVLPFREVFRAVRSVDPAIWFGSLGLFLLGHIFGAIKWRLMLGIGGARLEALTTIKCYAAGLFSNLCLPTVVGGDVVRATLAGRATGKLEAVFLGGIADRLIDIFATGLLIMAGGLIAGNALPGWQAELLIPVMIMIAGAASFFALVMLRRFRSWPRSIRRRVIRILRILQSYLRSPGRTLLALVASVSIQSMFIISNIWLGRSMGIEISNAAWFLTWPLAKLAGMLPISVGGIGVRDATLTALLQGFNVPAAQGLAVSLSWQSVLIVGGLLSGLIWILIDRLSKRTLQVSSGSALIAGSTSKN